MGMRSTGAAAARAGVWSAAVGAAVLAGCQAQPPRGDTSGRIGVTTTTPAEEASSAILPASLIEASNEVAESLARDVQRVSDEVGAGYRVTVIFGDIQNKTQGRVGTQEFELVRDRIKTKLNQSGLFRDNIRFVTSRARIEELNRRELGGERDLLQEGSRSSVDRPDPQYTLYINGTMYGIFRGPTNLYYLKFELDRASDGETVFSEDYEVKRG